LSLVAEGGELSMAIRRKGNTVEAERPEQEERRSSPAQSASDKPGTNGAHNAGGPVPVTPMAQNRNAADMEDRIRQRAYEIYEARGRQDGRADEDWLIAEEEITGITGGG
jgi:hypothetical protein